ncbi:hypothetical protein JWG45_02820 [Leptospira sp. 201903070]|uniref:DUF6817 domain-containing protein n=1 Tax=Leptospira ainlahdjerensis TaxID=2810033 RepID=A0ABS2U6S3_9LEPT|nr:hypothetical protein [Leptospira ainlahdjerensis]MBM9576076.1 hypothetical protein [Leptospira ainlahdjerensis]
MTEPDGILLDRLRKLNAEKFEHIHGDLLTHLIGTFRILADWGSPPVLYNAGLYHAVYGTFAYQNPLIGTEARKEIAEILGEESETLVFLYGSSDRDYFYSQFGKNETVKHKNWATREIQILTRKETEDLCELTAANELELALANDSFLKKYGEELKNLFERMHPYLSNVAFSECKNVFRSNTFRNTGLL